MGHLGELIYSHYLGGNIDSNITFLETTGVPVIGGSPIYNFLND